MRLKEKRLKCNISVVNCSIFVSNFREGHTLLLLFCYHYCYYYYYYYYYYYCYYYHYVNERFSSGGCYGDITPKERAIANGQRSFVSFLLFQLSNSFLRILASIYLLYHMDPMFHLIGHLMLLRMQIRVTNTYRLYRYFVFLVKLKALFFIFRRDHWFCRVRQDFWRRPKLESPKQVDKMVSNIIKCVLFSQGFLGSVRLIWSFSSLRIEISISFDSWKK